jgi:hypothetical protein
MGPTQLKLMLRAREGQGTLVLTHDRRSNRERMAARRLAERGLLLEPNYTGLVRNWRGQTVADGRAPGVYVYTLTKRGAQCWLRAKKETQ